MGSKGSGVPVGTYLADASNVLRKHRVHLDIYYNAVDKQWQAVVITQFATGNPGMSVKIGASSLEDIFDKVSVLLGR